MRSNSEAVNPLGAGLEVLRLWPVRQIGRLVSVIIRTGVETCGVSGMRVLSVSGNDTILTDSLHTKPLANH